MQPSGVKIQSSCANISIPVTVSLANSSIILPSGIPVTISSSGSIVATSSMSGAGIMPQTPSQQQQDQKQQRQPQLAQRVPLPPVPPVMAAQVTNNATAQPPPPPATPTLEENDEKWMDVVHTRNSSCIATLTNEKLSCMESETPVGKELECSKKIVGLNPGTCYKFRVAAVNGCGRGPWSEVSTFKTSTSLLGFPKAPSAIKINKSVDGATIAWKPQNDVNLEYSVYLAVKPPSNAPEPKPGVTNLSFVRVYCGPTNSCNVSAAFLNQALVVTTSPTKHVIIFKIEAKNYKGFGPATQVQWLQDSAVPYFTTKTRKRQKALKRAAPPQFTTSSSVGAKRGKADGK